MEQILLNVIQGEDPVFSTWSNIGYIKAILDRIPGVTVEIYFCDFDDLEKEVCNVAKKLPSIVYIPVFQFNYFAAVDFSEKLTKKLPSTKIIMGDIFASTYPSYILNKHSSVDYIVTGEVEFSLYELCMCILKGNHISSCKNIWYKDDFGIHLNDERQTDVKLDDYPFPDRSFYTDETTVFGVLGSRGCYGNCTFCDLNIFYRKNLRVRSIASIISEIELLVKNNRAKYIIFYDSTFCISREKAYNRLEELFYGLLNKKLDINFCMNLRAEIIDKNLVTILSKLYEVGLDRIYLGFESGNDDDLALYGKQASLQDNLNALDNLRRSKLLNERFDINVEYGFINYNPYSKLESIKKNLNFLKDSGLYVTFEKINTPYLNYGSCSLGKKIERDGLLLSLSGEPVTNPLGYQFVQPEIQTIYEMGIKYQQIIAKLVFLHPYQWISTYRRWKRFHPKHENEYEPVFELVIKTHKLLSRFIVDIMLDVVDKIDKGYFIDEIIEAHGAILQNTINSLQDDCKKIIMTYQKFAIDLYRKNEALLRKFQSTI